MKKILTCIITICLFSLCILGFASCSKEHEHVWDDGTITTEATCTEPGVKTFTCTECNETKTESIPATGHNFVDGVCSSCGEKESEPEPEHQHTWDDGKVTTPVTCTEPGIKTFTCTECSETKTESIPATGHNFVDGVCANCGEKVSIGLKYAIRDGMAFVIDIGTCKDTDIVIPSTYNGFPVVGIVEEAFLGTAITSITIPDSVITMGVGGITTGNDKLEKITVSPGNPRFHSSGNCLILTGSKALISGCKNSIIPSDGSVTSIVEYAFYGYSSLTSITIPGSVTSIGEEAFQHCRNLTSISIPYSVTNIGSDAFRECTALIQKENSIHYVDNWAIDCDDNITSAILRNDIVGIGDRAFSWCDSLASISIPASVVNIGIYAFSSCSSLENITVAYGNQKYHSSGNCIIETESKTLIAGCKNSIIPSDGSVTSIGDYAFYGCDSLTSIIIPDGVISIGGVAFASCDSLTSIIIPDSVTSIGDWAFYYCDSLTSVVFENTTGWYADGSPIDVSDPEENAKNLTALSTSIAWERK